MRTILSFNKHLYLKRVGIFLIAVALIVGTVSCDGTTPAKYDLTMAVASAGGGTATDETNASPYAEGTVVSIKAVPTAGYQFVNWTAPAGTFADVDAAETTFTMPAQDVTVTANFAFVAVYNLSMAANPAGGGTATDETGTSPYRAGTDVSIKAVANSPYQFVSWTAPAGTFADANAEETTFTMPAQDVTVTANFAFVAEPGPLDHFKCYSTESMEPIEEVVYLEDQFGAVEAVVNWAALFCNPVEKLHDEVLTLISDPDHHLTFYTIDYEGEPQTWQVEVDNQFGTQDLTVSGPLALGVPTQKLIPGEHEPPVGLDHFLLYYVEEGPYVEAVVGLNDQFGDEPEVWMFEPLFFANPVRKTHDGEITEIENPESHLVFYGIYSEYFETEVQVVNQFGEQTLDVYDPELLAVPSEKINVIGPPLPLDHFKCYGAEGVEPIGEVVYLEDQFGAVEAVVEWATLFCNPVEKWHEGVVTEISDPDHHLTVYSLSYEGEPQEWFVEVDNQFGTQNLTVSGPIMLAVPTQKEGHNPPVGLDHYLLYEVIEGPPMEVIVGLNDQFGDEPEVWMFEPLFFANPVQKTHGGNVTEIENPGAHLVFYEILGGTFFLPEVYVDNQFDEQFLAVYDPSLLAVPSEKTGFTAWPPLATGLYAGSSNPGVVWEYYGGTYWQAISSELGFAVLSLVEYDGHLYAGVMTADNIGRVYRYDGDTNWVLVGDNMDDQVASLAVYQDALYAGTAYSGMRLYRYNNSPGDWTLVVDYTPWSGTRALYIFSDYLLMGDFEMDYFGRWDGTNFHADYESGGSCIYDYEEYGDYVYAAAWEGRLWRSPDGVNWSLALDYYGTTMWEIETFGDQLYMAYDNGELRASSIPDRGTLVYTAPDGIISMTPDDDNLYFGTGGEAGYYYETTGIASVYKYDGTSTVLISGEDRFDAGVQVLYSAVPD